MKYKLLINKILNFNVDIYIFKKLNKFFLKNKIGVLSFYLNKNYFFNNNLKNLKFIFLNKKIFYNFLTQIFFLYKSFFKLYFFRVKLKGLGYRIRKINKNILRFFFAYNHYFYFFIPINIFVWTKKRNLLAISIDKIKLNTIFSQLLLIKKIDFLEKSKSFIIPKKILYIKK